MGAAPSAVASSIRALRRADALGLRRFQPGVGLRAWRLSTAAAVRQTPFRSGGRLRASAPRTRAARESGLSSRCCRHAPAVQALSSSMMARRCALCASACWRTCTSQASTSLWASVQASSNRFHSAWLGWPPWSVVFHWSRRLRRVSCILRPPRRWPSGACSKASALATSSSRSWSARQRCQPSSSPAWLKRGVGARLQRGARSDGRWT